MNANDEVITRLDRIIALLEIGFDQHIKAVRTQLRSDPVAAAILDLTHEDWISSGTIKRSVSKKSKVSEKTVQRAIATLVSGGALHAKGAGPSLSYRSSGIA